MHFSFDRVMVFVVDGAHYLTRMVWKYDLNVDGYYGVVVALEPLVLQAPGVGYIVPSSGGRIGCNGFLIGTKVMSCGV